MAFSGDHLSDFLENTICLNKIQTLDINKEINNTHLISAFSHNFSILCIYLNNGICFGTISGCFQDLSLALCSEVTSRRALEMISSLETEPGLVTCKARAEFLYYFSGSIFIYHLLQKITVWENKYFQISSYLLKKYKLISSYSEILKTVPWYI